MRVEVVRADGRLLVLAHRVVLARIRPEHCRNSGAVDVVERQRQPAADLHPVATLELEVDTPGGGDLGEGIDVVRQVVHGAVAAPKKAVGEVVTTLAPDDEALDVDVERH